MLKKISVLSALIAVFVVFAVSPQQAFAAPGDVIADIHGPSIDHDGVYVGNSFQVDILAQGISDAEGLAGGEFDIDYDETVLSVHTTAPNEPKLGAALDGLGTCTLTAPVDDGDVLSIAFACGSALDITTPIDVVLVTVIFEQTTPLVVTDTSVDFNINGLLLNDGTITNNEPDSQPIAGLDPLGGTANIYVGICGDQNDDTIINTIDATIDAFLAIDDTLTLSERRLVLSDVMQDGDINVGDVVATLQHIVSTVPVITACGPVDPLAGP